MRHKRGISEDRGFPGTGISGHPIRPSFIPQSAIRNPQWTPPPRGDEERGAVLLKKASDIDPFFAPANYELARWAAACAKRDEAIEYARRVLAVEDPGSPLAEKALLLLDKLIPEKEP